MKKPRDELLIIPENEVVGGFICPICQSVAIGARWAKHAKYCPDCGQRIKIDSKAFNDLKEKAEQLPEEQQKNICAYTAFIGIDGTWKKSISGIYAGRGIDGEDCSNA